MKVLILPLSCGGGHNSAGYALKEYFESQGDEAEVLDALHFAGKHISNIICKSYINLVKHNPKMFGHLYRFTAKSGWVTRKHENVHTPSYWFNRIYGKKMEKYLREKEFDAVFCVHIFPTQAMTHLKKRHNINIPFYFVSTDYYPCPLLEETRPNAIFMAHEDPKYAFLERKINENLLVPTGIPVSQKFVNHGNKEEIKKNLGFPLDSKIMLVMCGSMGFGSTLEITKNIFASTKKDIRVVVITGSNKKLYKKFEKTFKDDPRLVLLGYTDKVADYMDICDMILTKPGGLSSTEALTKGIPIIHTAPIPGCETENVQFFTEHHLSLCALSSYDASRLALRLLEDDFVVQQIKNAQTEYRFENPAKNIYDYVKSHYQQDTQNNINARKNKNS